MSGNSIQIRKYILWGIVWSDGAVTLQDIQLMLIQKAYECALNQRKRSNLSDVRRELISVSNWLYGGNEAYRQNVNPNAPTVPQDWSKRIRELIDIFSEKFYQFVNREYSEQSVETLINDIRIISDKITRPQS